MIIYDFIESNIYIKMYMVLKSALAIHIYLFYPSREQKFWTGKKVTTRRIQYHKVCFVTRKKFAKVMFPHSCPGATCCV